MIIASASIDSSTLKMSTLMKRNWNAISPPAIPTQNEEIAVEDLPRQFRSADTASLGGYRLEEFSSLKQAVMDFEAHLIQEAVKRCGSARKAAHSLKDDPTTITRKIKKFKSSDA